MRWGRRANDTQTLTPAPRTFFRTFGVCSAPLRSSLLTARAGRRAEPSRSELPGPMLCCAGAPAQVEVNRRKCFGGSGSARRQQLCDAPHGASAPRPAPSRPVLVPRPCRVPSRPVHTCNASRPFARARTQNIHVRQTALMNWQHMTSFDSESCRVHRRTRTRFR